jgi:nanoRNase/pAp phosphatase (c-di-AMP/oligoRNAs hydrolase)
MVERLVLGCGDLCFSLVGTVREWPGGLQVVDPDPANVEQLRELSVAATVADITDPAALRDLDLDPDVVVVLADDPDRRSEIVAAGRGTFPEAHLVTLPEPAAASQEEAETVFSPGGAVLEAIDEAVTDPMADRLAALRETLTEMDGRLVIVTHDNPDPDALGAALALRAIAEFFDVESEIAYFGDITHQENRAFVNLLEVDVRQLSIPADIGGDHIALVDHSRPGINNQLPRGMPIDVVIDHHPSPVVPEATFVDVRESVGATSTLLVDYLEGYGIDIDRAVATGLLYGIRVDTREFGREATARDFEAVATLISHADMEALKRIESPSVSPRTLETIGRAIHNRHVDSGLLTSCVGRLGSRDSLAQAADRLLGLQEITVTVVCGYHEDTVHVSGRSKGGVLDLGETFRAAFDDIGSAGGHDTMAGAQIPLSAIGPIGSEAEADRSRYVARAVRRRLEDAIERRGQPQ